ncbi:MAG: cold-shock protein [Thermoplasmata archaeon M11B2D]|nr:MAG: cold-shock protein [Thermoplasmata archaeon M11B2D]PNX50248.1 MAG: cold-shock protein [Thermoplasmata archaeon M9B2D]PNX54252.1 MAG: cold-shock protein [Thermoplasmata archaeon M9B2D]
MKGTVKFYDIRKGYGFIRGDDGHTIFVHRTAIPFFDIFLLPGEVVEYQIDQTMRGPKATNVKKL